HAEQTLTKAITLGQVRRMNSSVANRRLRYYRRQTLEYYLGDGGRQSRIVTQGVVTSMLSGRKIGGYAGRQASRSLNRSSRQWYRFSTSRNNSSIPAVSRVTLS